jgi:hypothetical protein
MESSYEWRKPKVLSSLVNLWTLFGHQEAEHDAGFWNSAKGSYISRAVVIHKTYWTSDKQTSK